MNFKALKPSDTIEEWMSKIEYNFNQILLNGGGPSGDRGITGETGGYGATGKTGPKGESGVKGSTIWFETGTIGDGEVVNIVDHPDYNEGDIVISDNGNYYQITEVGGVLTYQYQFNFSITPLSYFIDQFNFDLAGQATGKWHLFNGDDSRESNVMLVKKTTGSGANDDANFYRLFLGLDANPTIVNSSLIVANILPHETSAQTNAVDNAFSQIALKYRADSRHAPTVNSVFIKYEETENLWAFSINNSGVKLKLDYDNSDPALARATLESALQTFKTADSANSHITVSHNTTMTMINSMKDLVFHSLDNSLYFLRFYQKKVKFNYAGDTEISAAQDAYNLNFLANVHFQRKFKKANIIIAINAQKTIDISNANTRPIIYLDAATNGVLAKITGGDDNDIITISAKDVPFRMQIKETPLAYEIGGPIGSQSNSEFEVSNLETITLYRRSGQNYWTILAVNKRNEFDYTLYKTSDLQWSSNPMEGLMSFIPGFYKLYGSNYSDISGQPFLPTTAYDETEGSVIQIMNTEHLGVTGFSRLFVLYKSNKQSGTLKNEVWIRRGECTFSNYKFSDWERLSTDTDIANLRINLVNYIDEQITLAMANIIYRLVPVFSILPYYYTGPLTDKFTSTGAGKVGTDLVNWQVCNGLGGAPDMRGRSIVGAVNIASVSTGAPSMPSATDPNSSENAGINVNYSVGTIGGENRHINVLQEIPRHQHNTFDTGYLRKDDAGDGNQAYGSEPGTDNRLTGFAGGETNGTTRPHENRSPFRAMVYIMRMNITNPPVPVAPAPQNLQITNRSLNLYTFRFDYPDYGPTNLITSIDLKYSINGDDDTIITLPFSALTQAGTIFTFTVSIPGFQAGQYAFNVRIMDNLNAYSQYNSQTVVDDVVNTSNFIMNFRTLTSPNFGYRIDAIRLTKVSDSSIIDLLTLNDPPIDPPRGIVQFAVPPGIYNIQLTVGGPSSGIVGTLSLQYTDTPTGSDIIPYTGPSVYFFNNKTISDNSAYVLLNYAP